MVIKSDDYLTQFLLSQSMQQHAPRHRFYTMLKHKNALPLTKRDFGVNNRDA